MKNLVIFLSCMLLDAIVPAGCRNEVGPYTHYNDASEDTIEDTLDVFDTDSVEIVKQ